MFFFKTLHLQDRDQDQDLYAQDRDQDQDLYAQDRDQDQDLYSRDRDQDQDIKIRSRDGLETRHCLETSHHWALLLPYYGNSNTFKVGAIKKLEEKTF